MHTISIQSAVQSIILFVIVVHAIFQTACTPTLANTELDQNINQEIPYFILSDYHGNEYCSSDYKGKYLVIHIATTWCPFCNAEAPNLEKLYQEYMAQNVEVLIIDVKEDKDLVKQRLIDRFELSFPVLMDENGEVAASFAPDDVLPDLSRDEVMLASNLIIAPDGSIRFFSLLDTQNFDAQLIELKAVLDSLVK